MDGFFGKGRRLTATEIISISFNLKKSIMAKTLSIGFSQVAQSKEVRKFLEDSEKQLITNTILFKNNAHG